MNRLVSGLRWFFTDPDTGKIVIAQSPNAPLIGFFAAKGVELLTTGKTSDIAGWISAGLLVYWAADEIIRGACPWRKSVGVVVLAGQTAALLRP